MCKFIIFFLIALPNVWAIDRLEDKVKKSRKNNSVYITISAKFRTNKRDGLEGPFKVYVAILSKEKRHKVYRIRKVWYGTQPWLSDTDEVHPTMTDRANSDEKLYRVLVIWQEVDDKNKVLFYKGTSKFKKSWEKLLLAKPFAVVDTKGEITYGQKWDITKQEF